MVLCRDIIAEEVVHHLLNLSTNLHVSLHVDFLNLEACILQHLLNGDDVSVTSTPRERSNGSIDVVTTIATYLKDACHVEARASV